MQPPHEVASNGSPAAHRDVRAVGTATSLGQDEVAHGAAQVVRQVEDFVSDRMQRS